VIVNPGAAIEARANPDDPTLSERIPCMILMNSLKNCEFIEPLEVKRTVVDWLNREWERIILRDDISSPWKETINFWRSKKAANIWESPPFCAKTLPIFYPNGNVQVNV
jgi:hypothetical protein